MRIFFASAGLICFFCFSSPLRAAVYEWIDDKGVVHFTDNADKIPNKYLGKAKEKKSDNNRITVIPPSTSMDAPAGNASKPSVGGSFGGYGKNWWLSRFSELRSEKKTLELGLIAKKEKLNNLRRKKAIYQRGSDRTAYNEQNEEILRDEARLKELEQKLAILDADAARAGVPLEWRQ